MDIYKLTDEVGVRGDSADGSVGGGVELVITGLKQGVRNPERVNVYINGKYELSLDIAQVVDAKVKIGRALTEDELFELRRMSEFGKLYQRALEWVLARPHSERETYDYLCKNNAFNNPSIDEMDVIKNVYGNIVNGAIDINKTESIMYKGKQYNILVRFGL